MLVELNREEIELLTGWYWCINDDLVDITNEDKKLLNKLQLSLESGETPLIMPNTSFSISEKDDNV